MAINCRVDVKVHVLRLGNFFPALVEVKPNLELAVVIVVQPHAERIGIERDKADFVAAHHLNYVKSRAIFEIARPGLEMFA